MRLAGRGLSITSVRRSQVPPSDAGCRLWGGGGGLPSRRLLLGEGRPQDTSPQKVHLGEMNRLSDSHPASVKLTRHGLLRVWRFISYVTLGKFPSAVTYDSMIPKGSRKASSPSARNPEGPAPREGGNHTGSSPPKREPHPGGRTASWPLVSNIPFMGL